MRTLVLGGGGALGAWQAGALTVLAAAGEHPDLVCGNSVGAINGGHLAQYPVGEDVAAARDLVDLWRALRPRDVHRRWFPLGSLHALWRGGLRDSRPLRRLLGRHLSRSRIANSGRRLIVGAIDLESGLWREWGGADESIVDAVYASAAQPVAFPPALLGGSQSTDGGLRTIVPLQTAVDCGATSIDVLVCCPSALPAWEPSWSVVALGRRYLDVMLHQIEQDDLRVPCCVPVRILRPTRSLGDSLDFSPGAIASRLSRGVEDASAGRWEVLWEVLCG